MTIPCNLNHIIYNTGQNEQVSIKGFSLRPYDRIALSWILEQAQSQEGVDIDDGVILKIHKDTYRYTATFGYGAYDANEAFLISFGARTKDGLKGLWNQLRTVYGPKYQVTTPIATKPIGPMVVDMILPGSSPEGMAYLHGSDCYDFCGKLGWALLYPDSIRV